MSSICGFFQLSNITEGNINISNMVNAMNHWNADDTGKWSTSSVSLGHLMLHNSKESLEEKLPFYDTEAKICITSNARIDNRAELSKIFGIRIKDIDNNADSWFILEAYKKWGNDCPKYLQGDFVFAIWDETNKKLFCARDRLGVKPFYYYYNDKIFAFASEIKGILSLPEINASINKQWIGDFLMGIRLDRHTTFYENILKLEPAHILTIQAGDKHLRNYWELDTTTEIRFSKESDYVEAFLEKYQKAIDSRLRSKWRISCELSGGLDSSSIAALCQPKLQKSKSGLITFSDVMPLNLPKGMPKPIDDRALISEVIDFVGIKDYHFMSRDDKSLLNAMDDSIKIQDEPPREFLNIFFDHIMEKAQKMESRVLLSGLGGDDVVSSFGHFYHEELFLTGNWRELRKDVLLRSKKWNHSVTKKMSLVIINAMTNLLGLENKWDLFKSKAQRLSYEDKVSKAGLQAEFAKTFNIRERYNQKLRVGLEGSNTREKMAFRINYPSNFINRLECGAHATLHRKLEYRYPLLDIQLIQFFTSIPATERNKNGERRYFFRNAMKGIIPANVIDYRNSRGNTTPSTLWRRNFEDDNILNYLKSINKDDSINEFVDLKSYIRSVEESHKRFDFGKRKGHRVILLHKKLQQLKSGTMGS